MAHCVGCNGPQWKQSVPRVATLQIAFAESREAIPREAIPRDASFGFMSLFLVLSLKRRGMGEKAFGVVPFSAMLNEGKMRRDKN